MISKHLTDDEIQQYALNRSDCGDKIIEHIKLCKECNAKAAAYKLLFSGISQQQTPGFDFNLSELVLAQLPPPKPIPLGNRFFIYLLTFLVVLLAGALVYVFRGYAVSLFASIAPFAVYLIATTIVTLFIFLCIDMYKNYYKKITIVDLY